MIEPGTPAPAFALPADDGSTVSLADCAGRNVVLYFYPKDDTPGCTTEACDFRDSLAQLSSLGAVVLGVSADSVARHAKFRDKYQLNFRLLSDESTEMMQAYGVWQIKKNYGKEYWGIVRTTYLIDGKGVVRRVFPNVRVQKKDKAGNVVHRHVDEVRAALAELK